MAEDMGDKDIVKTAGRGVIYITFAKVWFMLTGWALVFVLPRLFKWSVGGDEEQGQALYGAYGIVFTGVSFINNGIIAGTIQAVSKFTSEDESQAGAVKRTALLVQGGIGLVLAALYVGLAGILAEHWFQSPALTSLMRLSAGVIVAYSCYAVFIGSFNGLKRFNRQALFDIVYATFKIALMLALVAAGFEVLGTVLGFLIAAAVIAVAAGVASGGFGGGAFPAKRYVSFAATILVYSFVLNLVMMLDLYLLSGLVPRLALEAGHDPSKLATLTEVRAGQYKAMQQLAFIPYQAVLAIAFVIFPLISKVTFDGDQERSKVYVRTTLRFTMILIIGLVAVFAALPQQALDLVFPREYQAAAPALSVLPIGIAAFGLMVVSNTIMSGAGHPGRALGVVLGALVAVVVSVFTLVSKSGPGPESLTATAGGTSIGMVVGLVISGIVVYRRFGTFWPWLSLLRVGVAAGVAVTAGRFMPMLGKLVTLGECVAVLIIYLVVLALLREFKSEDVARLKQVIRRG
jgi:O-antigen/teichoic acid export membrane protein